MKLTGKQFKGLVNDLHDPDNGGFSVNSAGESPSGGFMVARAGNERSIPIDQATVPALRQYTRDKAGPLAQPNSYFGGWHDKSRGMVDLDVSQHIPDTPGVPPAVGHADAATSALDLSIARNQRAAFDLNTFEDLPNPDFKKPKKSDRR